MGIRRKRYVRCKAFIKVPGTWYKTPSPVVASTITIANISAALTERQTLL